MASAFYPSRADPSSIAPNVQLSLYPRALMTELDFKDTRYPQLPTPTSRSYRSSTLPASADRISPDTLASDSVRTPERPWPEHDPLRWVPDGDADLHSQRSQSQLSQQVRHESAVSYALPPGAARRVVERYSLDDAAPAPSGGSAGTRTAAQDAAQDAHMQQARAQSSGQSPAPSHERPPSFAPSTPRHPALPQVNGGAGRSASPGFSPIVPASASPGYSNIPISPNLRAYAQHPTYITPPQAPNPVNPVFSPNPPPPQEEVCIECAMRDQDMADVDVTSPGVWERHSDVHYEELLQRELEEEAAGIMSNSSRPRARGGRLTEQNLKIWLSVNPREPTSRQLTLDNYLKSQRTLLEAESLAHARAMQEAKQLDSRMRDAYSQLRKSAYDMGSSAAPADDSGGVRIKPPRSPVVSNPAHIRSHSREVTLLENGMIVEHVDVRREEKEERERRRKDERRARKLSRGSVMDVTSLYSAQSLAPHTDSGLGLKPYSRYSQSSSVRPTSVLTVPMERPDLPRAYSQASFSDVHSLSSGSPRRTRFFGFKNLSAGWRSQESLAPSGMSGSMVDMHVALQRETIKQKRTQSAMDTNASRRSQVWPPPEVEHPELQRALSDEKPRKKKTGLAKIWRIVTGSRDSAPGVEPPHVFNEDDLPLAPPPPLSYLVDRGDIVNSPIRNASTPSLPSSASPRNGLSSPGMSPATAPSSIFPPPVSSRASGSDVEPAPEGRMNNDIHEHAEDAEYGDKTPAMRAFVSDSDIRQHVNPASQSATSGPRTSALTASRPMSVMSRDKSLPPLPGEPNARQPSFPTDTRPRTLYTYDPRAPGSPGPTHDFLPPQAPFRNGDGRRQSFGGMTSRPNLQLQTRPLSRTLARDVPAAFGAQYDEFGFSRQSLGAADHMRERSPVRNATTPSKRKSRFGFASLLGRKSPAPERELSPTAGIRHPFPMAGASDGLDDGLTNGHATSISRHSAFSGTGPRMSVTSRKPLEELVAQDTDFVAYRYPSNDQRLDLLR